MKKVVYSQLVKRKLLKLKKRLAGEYGGQRTKDKGNPYVHDRSCRYAWIA